MPTKHLLARQTQHAMFAWGLVLLLGLGVRAAGVLADSTGPVALQAVAAPTITRPLDVNTATEAQWAAIQGVGPALAQKIVCVRGLLAGFDSVGMLAHEVPGIGPALLNRMRPFLRLDDSTLAQRRAAGPDTVWARSPRKYDLNTISRDSLEAHCWLRKTTIKKLLQMQKRKMGIERWAEILAIPGMRPVEHYHLRTHFVLSPRVGQAGLDLNTAAPADLQRLPGVGPALAQRIVDYRTRLGGYCQVGQLDEVRGVGPATLEKLRPYVRVGSPHRRLRVQPPDSAAWAAHPYAGTRAAQVLQEWKRANALPADSAAMARHPVFSPGVLARLMPYLLF